jgi:hypothetical protein
MVTYFYSFFNQVLQVALTASGFLLTISSVQAAECKMNRAFMQPDGNAKHGQTAVWSDEQSSSLLFIESLNVNTDGTRRSYSVEDFWGEKSALNNLCNAMSDACAGLSKEALKTRRITTQKAHADGWPAAQLQQTKISPAIIPFKGGKPCPLVDDFLVSATALHKPHIADVCDISNYVDALTTPAMVIPKKSEFTKRAKVGDLVVTMVPGANQPVYAVVGDTGPTRELGEGSIALNGKLLGKTSLPTNYLEVRGKGEFKGRGWTVPQAIVLIFPGTRDVANPFMTPERIDEAAKKRFDEWGGVERLNTCAAQYQQ